MPREARQKALGRSFRTSLLPEFGSCRGAHKALGLFDRRLRRHLTALEPPYLNAYGRPIEKTGDIYANLFNTAFSWHPNHPLSP